MWTLEEPVGRFDSKLSEYISVCARFIFPEQNQAYGLVTLCKSSGIYLWQTELQRAWTLESSSIRNCGGHSGHQMGKSWVRCWSVEAGSRVGHDVVGTEHL
jgi:hypothetical protein